MNARVDGTSFGRITIGGRVYTHDVVLTPAGEVADRWTVLANPAGSHLVAEEDAEYLAAQGAPRVIVGTGQYGALRLSEDAEACFRQHGCEVTLAPTPEAIALYNATEGPVTALFHLTC